VLSFINGSSGVAKGAPEGEGIRAAQPRGAQPRAAQLKSSSNSRGLRKTRGWLGGPSGSMPGQVRGPVPAGAGLAQWLCAGLCMKCYERQAHLAKQRYLWHICPAWLAARQAHIAQHRSRAGARGGVEGPLAAGRLGTSLAKRLVQSTVKLLVHIAAADGAGVNRCEQQGRERKVTRSIGSGYGYSYGYDGQMSDPQGMPLTGNAPWGWGTTGHAANRHCSALAGASARSGHFPPECGMEGTKRQCRGERVSILVSIRRMLPPLRGPIKL
jgi:hypothetical protein